MHWAAIGGHTAAGEALADAGANLFATTTSQMSVLHASCEAGRAGFAEFLIKRAGDRKKELFDARDADGKLAIELATLVRRMQAIILLRTSFQNNSITPSCQYA
jgi:ankyrin repeat protein